MNISDLNALSGITLLFPSVNTATVTGPVVDLQQYIGTMKLTQRVGAVTGTLNGFVQDSADGVNFLPVTTANLAFAQVSAANGEQSIQLDTRSVRRYVQYTGTIAGTNASIVISVSSLGEHKVK